MILFMSSGSLSRIASNFCGRVFCPELRQKKRDVTACLHRAWPETAFSVVCYPSSVEVTFPLQYGEKESYFINTRAPSAPHADKYERWKTDNTPQVFIHSAETARWARPIVYRKQVSLEMLDGDVLTGSRRERMDRIRTCVAQVYGAPGPS